jgi:ABC-type iron transport system FetAB permease component
VEVIFEGEDGEGRGNQAGPESGMILGYAITSAALAGDRLQSDLRAPDGRDRGHARPRLPRQRSGPADGALGRRGRDDPDVSGMMTVGLVQLPGMMTGQILAVASLLFVRLAVRRYLTSAHQLRRYLL